MAFNVVKIAIQISCIIQIASAFLLLILWLRMEQRKCENADDTKQIEDHTKQNKRRQSSWDPNSVGLGLGYFERANLTL
ncbi:hypothetical protein T01_6689 [Trichinella spiralis]|uniref:Uncharacterized protein n=1 Tax=Trichinella spiralis TaxID=6334 RepID=A0A0V1AXY1_TRISP|nr:hypothetical protein T01_6689 [Trichinella spiralis]